MVKPLRIYWSKRYWVAVASAEPWEGLHHAPHSWPRQHLPLRSDALPASQPTASKHWRQQTVRNNVMKTRSIATPQLAQRAFFCCNITVLQLYIPLNRWFLTSLPLMISRSVQIHRQQQPSALTLLAERQEGHPASNQTDRCDVGVVIYLQWSADLHTVQLMWMPLTVSCFSKSRLALPYGTGRLTWVVPDKQPLNGRC